MNNIRSLRESRDLTQKALAIDLHVSQATISSWESGKKKMSNKSAANMADYFDVSIDYLLGRSEFSSPTKKQPIVEDDELRTKAIERVQALPDPALSRVLDFLEGLEAGREIAAADTAATDRADESSE